MKQSCKPLQILSILLYVILCLLEVLLLLRIISFQVIPTCWLLPSAAVTITLTIVLGIFLFPGKKRSQKHWCRPVQVLAAVLALVLCCGCSVGYLVLNQLGQTLNTVTQAPVASAKIGVYVRSEDPAEQIADVAGYVTGVVPTYDTENTQQALDYLQDELNPPCELISYDDVLTMVDALYNEQVQAIVLNCAYLDILDELPMFADFSERTKLLGEYDVIAPTTEPTISAQPSEDTSAPTEATDLSSSLYDPFIVYLSGSDSYANSVTNCRSDVNILAAVNPRTKQILLVSTPRDYFVPNPACGGRLDKLTHCGIYGMECSMQALGDLYQQTVTYNARISFKGFETLIDAVGGITVHSDIDDGVFLKPGDNHMDGKLALRFASNRKSYSDGDNARGRHQMQVISILVDQLTSTSLITNYSEILKSLEGMFVTSVPSEMITSYIKMQLSDMAHWEVFSYAVTGFNGSEKTASMPSMYCYVMIPDTNTVAHASHLLDRIISGDRLNADEIPYVPAE